MYECKANHSLVQCRPFGRLVRTAHAIGSSCTCARVCRSSLESLRSCQEVITADAHIARTQLEALLFHKESRCSGSSVRNAEKPHSTSRLAWASCCARSSCNQVHISPRLKLKHVLRCKAR